MSFSQRIPRSLGAGNTVVTGNGWNHIANHVDGLKTGHALSGTYHHTAAGTVYFPRQRNWSYDAWEMLYDANAKEVTFWPEGAVLYGPTVDPQGEDTKEPDSSFLFPQRFGHPWIPKVTGNYIDRKLQSTGRYPTMPVVEGDDKNFFWLRISVEERSVPFGTDSQQDPEQDPRYGLPVEEDLGQAGELLYTTENNNEPPDAHSHEVDLGGITSNAAMHVRIRMGWFSVVDCEIIRTEGDGPTMSVNDRYVQIGWIQHPSSGEYTYRQMLAGGPVWFPQDTFVAYEGTGNNEPNPGLADVVPLPPRGNRSNDSQNDGRGAP